LNFKKNITRNVSLLFITMLLAVTTLSFFIFTGCMGGEVTDEQPVISETEEEGEDIEEEPGEDEEDKIAGVEITGNINILSGLEISDIVANSRPLAFMVDNNIPARPQSGLHLADIVFEVVDEAGITRYVAIYSSYDAEIVGPMRSARIYYAEIARGFDPVYTFWGTYTDAYETLKLMHMDLLDGNSDAYVPYTDSGWRDYSRIEPGEDTAHTAFMSTVKIKEDAVKHGYSLDGGQSPLRFKADAVESERGDVSDITIDFSDNRFKVDFKYNENENNYQRYLAGSLHTDHETGRHIAVNNVIVMITDIEGPIDEAGHMVVRTTGTGDIGKAFYFIDGNVIEGTWERTSILDPFKYKDNNGNLMLFNRGSTWVAMIQSTSRLMY